MVKKDVHDELKDFYTAKLKKKFHAPAIPVHNMRTDKFDIDQSFSGSQKETKNKDNNTAKKGSSIRGRSKSAKSRTTARVELPKMSSSNHRRNKSSLTNIKIKKGGLTGKNAKNVAVTNVLGRASKKQPRLL